MNLSRRRVSLLLGLLALPLAASAQEPYPIRAITLVVPFPPGGAVDVVARAISPVLAQNLGQPVVIENIGGGTGSIGAAKVARAAPDGYTLLLGNVNEVVLAPLVNASVTYRTEDFAAVGKIGESSYLLVGRPGLGVRNFDELVELARRKPGALSYATSGIGSAQHVIMQDLQERTGISLLHVPYRGGTSLVTDVIGGQVDLALVAPAAVTEHVASGRLQGFGTAGLKRDELLKDMPTLNEGRHLRGLDQTAWLGLFAPARTPPQVSRRLAAAVGVVLADGGVAGQLKRLALMPATAADQPGFGATVNATRSHMAGLMDRMKLNRPEAAR